MQHYPLITASLSTTDEVLYKHTFVENKFCRRTKLIFLRNSLLRYAVTHGRCALPSCKCISKLLQLVVNIVQVEGILFVLISLVVNIDLSSQN